MSASSKPDYLRDRLLQPFFSVLPVIVIFVEISLFLVARKLHDTSRNLSIYAAGACALMISIFAVATVRWATDKSKRPKIMALLILYVSLCITFGYNYYRIFLRDFTKFSFSPSIVEGVAMDSFARDMAAIRERNEGLLRLVSLEGDAAVAWDAASRPATLDAGGGGAPGAAGGRFRPLRGGYYAVRFTTTKDRGSGRPVLHSIEVRDSATSSTSTFSCAGHEAVRYKNYSDDRGRFIDGIFDARTPHELRLNLRGFAGAVQEETDRLSLRARRSVLNTHEWQFEDFIYFSVITMTTVGYGDITPNSGEVRFWVTVQSILSVFYIGFAIDFLGTKPRLSGGG